MPDIPAPASSKRDRFLTFAFAAADMLVETGPDATIGWAAGAFASRFGAPAESFVGQPVESLIAPADRSALAHALALSALHGRLAPLILRLNDTRETRCALGALALPGQPGQLCLTFSAVPVEPMPIAGNLTDRSSLASEAEACLRAGLPRTLGLVDIAGWAASNTALSGAERKALRADIMEALAELGGPGALIGEVGHGRYSVLGAAGLDLDALVANLRQRVQSHPNGRGAHVSGQAVPLAAPGLTAGQATRALRFALARFAEGGLAATAASGFTRGLAGFISTTQGKAAALRARIAARKFRLVYQPVVSLADRRAHHYETLLRPSPDSDGKTASTQDFVTLIEAIGLAEELDLAVLDEAIITLRETREAQIAVNVSGLSMQSAEFREQLLARIPDNGRLAIELTETADIADTASVAETLRRLRAAGVAVCIDDFGAGSAAFRYLRDFRVDYVKIDGAYVRAATRGPRERGLVESMCGLARAVEAAVIAEMVETEAEAQLMASLGVQFAQGYLFGRPGLLPGARRR